MCFPRFSLPNCYLKYFAYLHTPNAPSYSRVIYLHRIRVAKKIILSKSSLSKKNLLILPFLLKVFTDCYNEEGDSDFLIPVTHEIEGRR